jgi:hypothetical protein
MDEIKQIPYRRHLAVKEDTFVEFINLKEQFKFKNQDAFIKELLKNYSQKMVVENV